MFNFEHGGLGRRAPLLLFVRFSDGPSLNSHEIQSRISGGSEEKAFEESVYE